MYVYIYFTCHTGEVPYTRQKVLKVKEARKRRHTHIYVYIYFTCHTEHIHYTCQEVLKVVIHRAYPLRLSESVKG